MNVLVLAEFPTLLGGERSLLAMAGHLAGPNLKFAFACPGNGPLADAIHTANHELVPFDLRDGNGRRFELSACREQLASLLRRYNADVVHANSLSMSRIAGPVCQELSVASVGHVRDIIKCSRQVVRDTGRNERVLHVSQATRDFHVDQGLPPQNSFVLYNGIAMPADSRVDLSVKLGGTANEMVVVNVGQLIMRKGLEQFVDIAKVVLAERSDVRFIHIGSRYSEKDEAYEYERQLRERTESWDRFHWLGTRTDVLEVLQGADLLLHTARQEPFGRVLLEAAAQGTAIVASEVGGTREMFPQSEQACLFAPQDTDAAVVHTLRLLDDAEGRRSMGVAARERIRTAFSLAERARELRGHYEAVR